MNFDQAAVSALFSRIVSPCAQLAVFRSGVIQHEPMAAPTGNPALAIWFASIGPARGFSGLSATAARVEFGGRIYVPFTRPEEDTDAKLLTLTSLVIGAFTSGFTLDGDVAAVDVLGAWGAPLSATASYAELGSTEFRLSELVIPIIADNVWSQTP